VIDLGWLAFGLFAVEYILGKTFKNDLTQVSGLFGMMFIGGFI